VDKLAKRLEFIVPIMQFTLQKNSFTFKKVTLVSGPIRLPTSVDTEDLGFCWLRRYKELTSKSKTTQKRYR
jgi:hypothetical protein